MRLHDGEGTLRDFEANRARRWGGRLRVASRAVVAGYRVAMVFSVATWAEVLAFLDECIRRRSR